ncbi:DUF3080 family protein [Mangrovimicrobium sediminis]|uniref:DUF3080 family protein n=1 Tax=Mangrovimicrobium sediminis TaxID=2562682 RepID=A0A4Z0LX35_9GAMM|nr:DUF3080 family protein [Haliea sp. SAOS-164]TGD71841.1 DUF3080 family protein [Haliea sp. SAOS-164]
MHHSSRNWASTQTPRTGRTWRAHRPWLPWLCLAGLGLLLTACSSGPDQPLHTYLQRLSRTLDLPAPAAPEPRLIPRLPRSGQMRLEVTGDRLGGLDFLDLHGCELQVTVGKRNSSLGRLARDSQLLLLELEYLRLAPACIDQLRAEGEVALAETLATAWEHKRTQLPARIFNATLAGEEYRTLWRPQPATTAYPDNTAGAVIDALAAVDALAARWLAGDYRADNRGFELLLSEIARGDGGQLWSALASQADWLALADAQLAERAAQGPLCAPRYRHAAADILPNVVRRFFIDAVQPRAAALGRRYHQLLPPQQALEARLAQVLPDNYQRWRSLREQQLPQLAAAPRRHVDALQALLADCGGPAPER